MDAVNVVLDDTPAPRALRRQAQRQDGQVPLYVQVRRTREARSSMSGRRAEWRQRRMVRGHWKHFKEHTRLAQANPHRIVGDARHGRCVKVWCPPHIKGPEDKPLVHKTRMVG